MLGAQSSKATPSGVSSSVTGTFGSTLGSIGPIPVGVFGTGGVSSGQSIGTEGGAGIAVGAFAGAGISGSVNVQAGLPPTIEAAFVFAAVFPFFGVGPVIDARVSLDTIGARAHIGIARGAGVLGFIGVVRQGPEASFNSIGKFSKSAGEAFVKCGQPCMNPAL